MTSLASEPDLLEEEMIAGVDGYRGQWVVVSEAQKVIELKAIRSLEQLLERDEFKTIVIDVPIGLTDIGPRKCDLEARRKLGPRKSSVFSAPIRGMLGARSYEEACEIRYRREGKRCSRQLYAILPLICEVDDLMTPELQQRVREGHPEVSFLAMAGWSMTYPKKSSAGIAERAAVLTESFPSLPDDLKNLRAQGLPPRAAIDVLDAYALLWTARRIRKGEACTLPKELERDNHQLQMEIVY